MEVKTVVNNLYRILRKTTKFVVRHVLYIAAADIKVL